MQRKLSGLFHSLEHIFGSVAAQVIRHSVNTIQGGFHIQAANKILGIVLVEVKGQLSHVLPVLGPAFGELYLGRAGLQEGGRDNI